MVRTKMPRKKTRWSIRQRLKEDRISQLPDPLICQILSHLPTNEAVKTSLLSTRWRNLWLWVPCLELSSANFSDINAFVNVGHRYFDSNRVSCIEKVKLYIAQSDQHDTSYVTSWIDASVKRNIQHLDVIYTSAPKISEVPVPPSFYICKTLVYLQLVQLSFNVADLSKLSTPESVSLPSLKTMHLELISYPNDATFEKLVSSCPVLEKLSVIGCVTDGFATVFRVFSGSLKKLRIKQHYCGHTFRPQVVIDAPLLGFLSIKDDLSDSFIVKNMRSDAKLKIWLDFCLEAYYKEDVLYKLSTIRDFLPGISEVKEMIISYNTFSVFCLYSKFEPLPQFRNMSSLHAKPHLTDLKRLPTFLESCPNLKSLILEWAGIYETMYSARMNLVNFAYVPECLLSSLEFVDIKRTISGQVVEMKLVRYFLENSAILKKLTLRLARNATQDVFFTSLAKIPRRSAVCEVVVL